MVAESAVKYSRFSSRRYTRGVSHHREFVKRLTTGSVTAITCRGMVMTSGKLQRTIHSHFVTAHHMTFCALIATYYLTNQNIPIIIKVIQTEEKTINQSLVYG